MTVPDISVVLNLHREAAFLARTVESLGEAMAFSQQSGTTLETVVVLDRPDRATSEAAGRAVSSLGAFGPVQRIEVDNGSVGLSRNDGIDRTSGTYVALADGDDLVSYNFFEVCLETARQGGDRTIVIPQYILAFGASSHIWKYHGSDQISPLMMFAEHPFVSRTFASRTIYQTLRYTDATSGRRGFEDWHFNATALANGFRFVPAENAMLFYRQRPGSIMTTSARRLIPHTEFFHPRTFLKLAGTSTGCARDALPREPWDQSRKEALRSNVVLELIRAANRIDHGVNHGLLDHSPCGSNWNGDLTLGAAYLDLCAAVDFDRYTDVLLVPDLNAGGAEKYILSVLDVLAMDNPDFRLLVLSGEPAPGHEWVDRLPEASTFIDLYDIAARWKRVSDINVLALRLIQSVAGTARVHLKSSAFAVSFATEFAVEIENCALTYYYFCEPVEWRRGVQFTAGYNANFFNQVGQRLSFVVSDNSALVDNAKGGLPLPERTRAIPASVSLARNSYDRREVTKVLWASRLHPEKRIDLVPLIARKLMETGGQWTVDMYGGGPGEAELLRHAASTNNLRLLGPYSHFSEIARPYGVFIYTSRYDGTPNVLLEAMAAGLPVIAPRVGGIRELLSEGAGIVLDDLEDDEEMAQLYVDALLELQDENRRIEVGRQALDRVAQRHNQQTFERNVRDLFAECTP
jgi:glycosyltransferase involved in cell wall biosynthesis